MSLTPKQEAFCREYLKDFNGTQAYLRAGYQCTARTARTNAARLLATAGVQAFLSTLRTETASSANLSIERTLEEIGRVAFANITDTVSFSDEGVTLQDSKELPANITAAIQSIRMDETTTVRQGQVGDEVIAVAVKQKSVKMHDKMRALGLLAKHFGITSDFNMAMAALKKYGLALIPDQESDTGWRLERYAADAITAAQADRAAEEFISEISEEE